MLSSRRDAVAAGLEVQPGILLHVGEGHELDRVALLDRRRDLREIAAVGARRAPRTPRRAARRARRRARIWYVDAVRSRPWLSPFRQIRPVSNPPVSTSSRRIAAVENDAAVVQVLRGGLAGLDR